MWERSEAASGTGLGTEAWMMGVCGHVVERRLLAPECASVLELCHKANVLHHGGVVWMGSTAKTGTPFSTMTVVFGVVLWYLVTTGMT